MKLNRVDFGPDEMPSVVHVAMTVDEMALIYNLSARTAPSDIDAAAGQGNRWSTANESLAAGANSFFNTFWEAGAEDVAPKFSVHTIADAKRARENPSA